jgi:hypothetical protein
MLRKETEFLKLKQPALPEGWEAYLWEVLPRGAGVPTHYEITGAVPRLLTSGPRRGRKTWRDGVGKATFVVEVAEFEAYLTKEEREVDREVHA